MKHKILSRSRPCPPENEKRLLTGVGDVLSIFEAHTDYDMPMRVSVLAGALTAVTIGLTDDEMIIMLIEFSAAIGANRDGLLAELRQEAEEVVAQVQLDMFSARH
jgi:hypothetical protein